MKNIHKINENIYITSNEEIKEGNWGFDGLHIFKCLKPFIANETTSGKNIPCFYIELDGKSNTFHETSYIKKIILTTDQSLDGIQAIDDEFLQWFVKNANESGVPFDICEVNDWLDDNGNIAFGSKERYKIIIPSEEPKYPIGGYAPGYYECICATCKIKFMGDKYASQCEPCAVEMTKEEPKQETLEEVELAILFHNTYEKLAPSFGYETREDTKYFDITTPNGKLMIAVCKEIIKWQQERMYSKEEVINILQEFKRYLSFGDEVSQAEWFEQFKNK